MKPCKLCLQKNVLPFLSCSVTIGYNRAANILEAMEAAGLVSKPNAMGKRTTLVPDREL